MAEILKNKINDNLSERSKETNDSLKKFLVEKVLDDSKEENKKLKEEIMSDVDLDEKLESALNKEHLTNFLTKMKDELALSGYTEAYNKRGKALTFGVQSALSVMGFDIGGKEIDGYYGNSTIKAVKQFQAWKKITVDGSAGEETITALLTAGLDAKITEEEKAKLDITTTSKKEKKEVGKDFYTTHTEFTEKDFGGVKNKIYKVEKFEEIPTNIAKDTVIDFGNYYFFSNGKVYDYGTDNKLVRTGDRSELDETGKWKEQITKNIVVDIPKEPIVTPEKPKVRTQEVNTDIFKVCDSTLRDVLNPFNKDTKAGIIARLNPEQKTWFSTHILGKDINSMTGFVIEQKNPSFLVSIWDRAVNSSKITLGTIPFESYYKDNKFSKEGVYDRVVTLVQGRIDSEKQAVAKLLKEKKNQETKQNVEKILNEFRGATFTLNELFPDKVGDISYEGYFNKFDNKKLEIRGSKYTKVISENLNDITKTKVQFDLDDDGNDEKYNINKTVMLGDILSNGKYNRAKAIAVLRPIVKDIVEKNFTV